MVKKFPLFCSKQKKNTISGGSLQYPNGFSRKLLFHLTFNQNFWTFFISGFYYYNFIITHPMTTSTTCKPQKSFHLHLYPVTKTNTWLSVLTD